MKKPIFYSLLLNAGFLLLFGYLCFFPGAGSSTSTSRAATDPAPPEASLRWDQLQSSDYNVYRDRLRAIGCPNQTIRDIITGDIRALYDGKRREVMSRLAGDAAQTALANLEKEEQDLLASLFGADAAEEIAETAPPSGNNTTSVAATPAASAPQMWPPPPGSQDLFIPGGGMGVVDIPAVLAVSTDDPKINSSQLDDLNDIRANFIKSVGVGGGNPNDPAYIARWKQAQKEADESTRAVLGTELYIQYESDAAHMVGN